MVPAAQVSEVQVPEVSEIPKIPKISAAQIREVPAAQGFRQMKVQVFQALQTVNPVEGEAFEPEEDVQECVAEYKPETPQERTENVLQSERLHFQTKKSSRLSNAFDDPCDGNDPCKLFGDNPSAAWEAYQKFQQQVREIQEMHQLDHVDIQSGHKRTGCPASKAETGRGGTSSKAQTGLELAKKGNSKHYNRRAHSWKSYSASKRLSAKWNQEIPNY